MIIALLMVWPMSLASSDTPLEIRLAIELDLKIMSEYRESRAVIEAAKLDQIIEEGSKVADFELKKMTLAQAYNYKPELVKRKMASMNRRQQKRAIIEAIREIAPQYKVDTKLILAMARTESNFNHKAVSSASARGVMQLIDSTAERVGVRDSFNPVENIHGGIRYIKGLMQKYPGKTHWALAAYNAGPGWVDHYKGIPPFNETEDYIRKVSKYYREF
jgi:soluble lytic murein transglycosylase-like protein